MNKRLLDGVRGVVFDLDGTLVDSVFDWPAIRDDLEVDQPSIIDFLNGLEGAEREERWRRMRDFERRATEAATVKEGAGELLELLRRRRMPTALVTNNTAENAHHLLDRFGLDFELVMTRDDGLWKPSGAPLEEAARRLGLTPEETLAVGDSHHDVAAAREAGCARIFLLHPRNGHLADQADLTFPDLPSLHRYLEEHL